MHMAATTRSACALALAMAVVAMATTTTMAQSSWEDFVNGHNAARDEMGLPHVSWDGNVAAYAEWYAGQRRGDCLLEHSDSQSAGYGENIFRGSSGWAWTAADAVNEWMKEKQFYDYDSNTCSTGPLLECGHYTQVMWSDTTSIGCARVDCDNDLGVFITCNYSPPGNWPGQRPWEPARSAA